MSGIEDRQGFFISLEGPDGCGKTTQMTVIEKYLKKKKIQHVMTEEPGGTRLGKALARLLLDPKRTETEPLAELFLYLADRAQHVGEVIMPALKTGMVVVTSRYGDATVAYQAFGRGLPLESLMNANDLAAGGVAPDLTFLLDLPPEVGLKRQKGKADRLEREKLDFHRKVRHGYQILAKSESERIKVIDASQKVEKVSEEIIGILEGVLY